MSKIPVAFGCGDRNGCQVAALWSSPLKTRARGARREEISAEWKGRADPVGETPGRGKQTITVRLAGTQYRQSSALGLAACLYACIATHRLHVCAIPFQCKDAILSYRYGQHPC